MQQLLKVHWQDEVEFIAFDEFKDFHRQINTTGQCGSTEVTYDANATFERRGDLRTLKLTYERANQTDPTVRAQPPGHIRYGSAVISWTSGAPVGEAQWKDDTNGNDWNGEVIVSVLGGQKLDVPKRAKKSVLVTPRPKQAEFRDALFQLDKQCVLTGEKCREALEAAHLVPVAQNGHEQIENGILLRADVHLLFDAGLVWFEVLGDHAAVKCSLGESMEHYVANLKKELPPSTFQRVKDALLQRAELPGGRGRDAKR